MKRKTLTLFLLLANLAGMANPVGRQQARGQAQAFMAQRGKQIKSEPLRAPGRTAATDAAEPLYVFNSEGGRGFVIIAGDDRVETVLGYTEQGTYDERSLPVNFRAWLMQTAEEIASLPEFAPSQTLKRVPAHQAVEPLIQTTWNQGTADSNGYIYNTMTPLIDGKHCLTGCVATAGAQLMYYYQYPKGQTQPMPAYEWGDMHRELAELPPTTFKWDDMKPAYFSADRGTPAATAVSELMLYCGYAAEMNYNIDGSGGSCYTLARNMAKLFDYDPYTWRGVDREAYTVCEWDSIIYHELAERRPVIFAGSAWTGGGHAFICDGYDEIGLYHFNWGWGGSYNGWFKLHVTNPYYSTPSYDGTFHSGYVINVYAIIGLQPNTGIVPEESISDYDTWETPVNDENDTWETPEPDGIVATASVSSIEGTTVAMSMINNNDQSYGFGYGIAELLEDGTLVVVDDSKAAYSSVTLPKGWGYTFAFNFASYNLPEGTHTLVPISRLAGEEAWKRCLPLDLSFRVTVAAGGNLSIQKLPIEQLEAENFRCYTSRLLGETQRVAFDLTNLGDNFDGRVYLFASQTDEKAIVNWIDVKVLADSTRHRTIYWPIDASAQTGTYNLWIATDRGGEHVLAQTTAEMVEGLIVSKFACNSSCQPGVQQTVRAHIVNPGGNNASYLYLFASTSSFSKNNYQSWQRLSVKEGGEKDLTFTFTPSDVGTYYLWLCSDATGNNVLAQTTVKISQTVEATDFAFPGYHFVGSLQPVVVTVASTGNEFTQPLYLFANQLSNVKGNAIFCAPAAIEADKTEDIVFYFKPSEATDYHVWICTDKDGQNVIGQSKVTILPQPSPTTLTGSDLKVSVDGTTALASVLVKNTGAYTYYGVLEAYLLLWDEEVSDYRYVTSSSTPERMLPAGEEQTAVVFFSNLLPGRSYRVRWYYYPIYGSSSWSDLAIQNFDVPEVVTEAAQLACAGVTAGMSATGVDASITVENTGAVVYADALRAELYVVEGDVSTFFAASEATPEEAIQPGNLSTLTAHFAGLEAGREYHVQWFYRPLPAGEWMPLADSLATSVGSLASAVTAEPYYTLSGTRLVGKPLQPGIYVRGGRKVLVK